MERVLITGGCGFIGTNLSLLLLEEDLDLLILDNCSQRSPHVLFEACEKEGLPKPTVNRLDVKDSNAFWDYTESADAIVHLAAFTNVRESTKHPSKDFENNSRGIFNGLELARKSDRIDRFVFASSNAAVGEVEGAVNEETIPSPLSPYGASKLHGEALCSAYNATYDIGTTALRFANAYGPYSSHKTSVIPKFLRRAKAGKNLEIYGDGEQTRDFIHSKDVASAIYEALINDNASGETYQVATATETRILDLAQWIQQLAKEDGKDVEITHSDPRKGEIKFNYSDIEKIRTELGWEPKRELKSSLGRLYQEL